QYPNYSLSNSGRMDHERFFLEMPAGGIGEAPELRLKLHSDRFQSPLRNINPLWLDPLP
ncbi:hypothetical protein RYX36_007757, partial [Vicia faba]